MSYEFMHRVATFGVPASTRHSDGTEVRHYGTKQWATVLQSIPQSDGTYEYEVRRADGTTGWWASYHIDYVRQSEGHGHE